MNRPQLFSLSDFSLNFKLVIQKYISLVKKKLKLDPKWFSSSLKTFDFKVCRSSFGSVFKDTKLPSSLDYLSQCFVTASVDEIPESLDNTESSILSFLEAVTKENMELKPALFQFTRAILMMMMGFEQNKLLPASLFWFASEYW